MAFRREFSPCNAKLRTKKEEQADIIVRACRVFEARTIWGKDISHITHPFSGMEFLTGLCCLGTPLGGLEKFGP